MFGDRNSQSAQSPERIANICDSIRLELEKKDLKKYVNSILTAHVVKTPSDTEAALDLLLQLRSKFRIPPLYRTGPHVLLHSQRRIRR